MEAEKKTVRVVTMSDTHDSHSKIDISSLPPADIFIHGGDFTCNSTGSQLARFRQFISLLPYKHKVVVAGNHDFALDKLSYQQSLKEKRHLKKEQIPVNTEEEIAKLKSCCTYLEHESVEIMGLKIFGSPYSPKQSDWGFQVKEQDAQKLWSMIPQKTDILITHGPPYGIHDQTILWKHIGCKALIERVQTIKPKLHVFGHIHESHGTTVKDGTIFNNASTVTYWHWGFNKPQVFNIPTH